MTSFAKLHAIYVYQRKPLIDQLSSPISGWFNPDFEWNPQKNGGIFYGEIILNLHLSYPLSCGWFINWVG